MDTPAEAIAQPWERAAQHLSGVLECRRGICAWERATDGRWYLIQVVPTLFPDEDVIEMRWGGRQRPPSRILRLPLEQTLDTVAWSRDICRRRQQHGYHPVYS